MVKTQSLYLTWACFVYTGSWDPRRTDRQTDIQNRHS